MLINYYVGTYVTMFIEDVCKESVSLPIPYSSCRVAAMFVVTNWVHFPVPIDMNYCITVTVTPLTGELNKVQQQSLCKK